MELETLIPLALERRGAGCHRCAAGGYADSARAAVRAALQPAVDDAAGGADSVVSGCTGKAGSPLLMHRFAKPMTGLLKFNLGMRCS